MQYPINVKIKVAWGDMDAFQHVNNTVFFKYFETARIAYFDKLGMMELMKETNIGPILAETSCKFIQPIIFPETIISQVKIIELKENSMIMEHKLTNENSHVYAIGMGRGVFFNYKEKSKVNTPEIILEKIKFYQPELF